MPNEFQITFPKIGSLFTFKVIVAAQQTFGEDQLMPIVGNCIITKVNHVDQFSFGNLMKLKTR